MNERIEELEFYINTEIDVLLTNKDQKERIQAAQNILEALYRISEAKLQDTKTKGNNLIKKE